MKPMSGKRLPPLPPPFGHNEPPSDFDILRDRISEKIGSLLADMDEFVRMIREMGIDETLERAAEYKRELDASRNEAEAARKDEKRPHDEAIKKIQAFWTPLIASANAASSKVGNIMQEELLKRKAAKEAEERRLRLEAERLREEAAQGFERAAKGADNLSPEGQEEVRAQAEAAYRTSKAVAEAAERVAGETAGVKVGDAPAVHVRTVRRVRLKFPPKSEIAQWNAAMLDFIDCVMKSPFAADLVEAMTKVANRIYRERHMVPPHCVEYDEHKVG